MKVRNIQHTAVLLLTVFAVLCGCLFTVSAVDGQIDTDREGSISVTVKADSGKETVTGGSLSLYKVADITFSDTKGCEYVYTDAFSGCDEALLEAPDTAQASAEFAEVAKSVQPVATENVGSDGVTFSGLSVGIYLVAQAEDAEGYQPVNAFTVSIPLIQNDAYVYDVDATPKAEPVDSIPGEEEPPTVSEPNVSEPVVSNPVVTANPVSNNGGTTTPDNNGTSISSGAKTGDIIMWSALGLAVIAVAITGIMAVGKRKGGAEE